MKYLMKQQLSSTSLRSVRSRRNRNAPNNELYDAVSSFPGFTPLLDCLLLAGKFVVLRNSVKVLNEVTIK